ncbi:MAG: hypothetical protein HYW51_00885 [Candidatus Doudnabacteria bacterium]|nr:hypothetical protein [Candidatus Doudnabacteria bacterium]
MSKFLSLGRNFAFKAVRLFLSLSLILQTASVPLAYAQEEESSEAATVSEEVKTEVEQALTASVEVAQELDIDLKQELDLPPDFDPTVPNGLINKIGYGFKQFGRGLKEVAYNTFASDASYTRVLEDHANQELFEAVKLHSEDAATHGEKVVEILAEFRDDLEGIKNRMPELKNSQPELARALSVKLTEDHIFVTPKVLDSLQENLLTVNPEAVPKLLEVKHQVLGATGETLVAASDGRAEVAQTLRTISEQSAKTPFSGFKNAELLSQTKKQLTTAPSEVQQAFDEAIDASLASVERNFEALPVDDEIKLQSFEQYIKQLPGSDLARIKLVEQLKNRPTIPPVMIARMQEMKAKLAETMSSRIQQVGEEGIRKAVSKMMFEFESPDLEDLKILGEFKELVPHEEIRAQISQQHEQQVQKFLNRFGDDANARQITAEFQTLMNKVETGAIMPDANLFKTLDSLKGRLTPEQQGFIEEMETKGKAEMLNRMKNDPHFTDRLGSFNPADLEVFDKIRGEVEAGFLPPPDFDFGARFDEIEQRQAANFRKFLEFQGQPEAVAQIKARFEQEVPGFVKEKFETKLKFDFEAEFRKHEELAREKETFFRQKFEEMKQEFEANFGHAEPGQRPQTFPGQPGFPFPGQVPFEQFEPPPFEQPNQPESDPSVYCSQKGGVWHDSYCELPNRDNPEEQTRTAPPPQENYDPAARCAESGGYWTGSDCRFESTKQQNDTLPPTYPPPDEQRQLESPENYAPPPDYTPPQDFTPPPPDSTFQSEVQGAHTELSMPSIYELFSSVFRF